MPLRPCRLGGRVCRLSVVQVACERGQSLAEFSDDGSERVEFCSEVFVSLGEVAVACEQGGAGGDEPGDLVGGKAVADGEGPAESFEFIVGELHPIQSIEQMFGW